jgi:hypothetical protein
MQHRVHKVAGAVAGEWTTGAVGSVGARCEAENKDAGSRIAEAGNGTRPVGLVEVGTAFGLSDALTVFAETRAKAAGDDRFTNLLEEWRRTLAGGGCHCIQ